VVAINVQEHFVVQNHGASKTCNEFQHTSRNASYPFGAIFQTNIKSISSEFRFECESTPLSFATLEIIIVFIIIAFLHHPTKPDQAPASKNQIPIRKCPDHQIYQSPFEIYPHVNVTSFHSPLGLLVPTIQIWKIKISVRHNVYCNHNFTLICKMSYPN
jgi:hypothetical protein